MVATLYDGRDRPAIDLEMDSPIPSEVRRSFHNQATDPLQLGTVP
jgi:hypothetical protein